MVTGTISWAAPIKAFVLDPFEFSVADAAVVKVEIKTENEDRLVVTFTLQNVFHENDAVLATRDAIEILAGRLSFELSCEIGEFHFIGCSLPTDASGAKYCVIADMVVAYDILEDTTRPSHERLMALLPTLQEAPDIRDSHLSLFRFSLRQNDPIARFMSLYNLLLFLNGDNQADVDAKINAIDNNVPVMPSPYVRRHKNGTETLFTRLRNEIAHTRGGTAPANTFKEVADHVGWLQEIVRQNLHLWRPPK